MGKDFVINAGDGAFYGPKIDFHIQDSLGRTWQCGTMQLDFQMPERFDREYVGEDGEKHRPVMIHRALLGSIERFIGVITEHFAGAFPVWLSPVQVKVLPVTDRAAEYADQVAAQLTENGFRVEVDDRNEKIGKKIREAGQAPPGRRPVIPRGTLRDRLIVRTSVVGIVLPTSVWWPSSCWWGVGQLHCHHPGRHEQPQRCPWPILPLAPDQKHPFGYGRVEYLTGILIAGIILFAGASFAVTSVQKIFTPTTKPTTPP